MLGFIIMTGLVNAWGARGAKYPTMQRIVPLKTKKTSWRNTNIEHWLIFSYIFYFTSLCICKMGITYSCNTTLLSYGCCED